MGTPLYNELSYVIYNGDTFTAIQLDAVNIASKALCYWSVFLALPHLYLKIRNAGVAKAFSEDTTSADLNEMKYLKEEMSNLAEFWNQRLINFLCDNSASFPLYNAASDDMYPTSQAYDSDMYLEQTPTDDELRFLKKYLS